MENGYVTTPFGRRPMSLGMLARQQLAENVPAGTTRNKWKLFRAVCEARPALRVTERSLTVLDALLSFHPREDLTEGQGLVVFPSNVQLSLRARGMAAATLRRHLAVLVDAGLVLRRDSPNGKRYARRDRQGEIGEAYGFSLAPLLARADEIETLAAKVLEDRKRLRVLRERLSICRRDVGKLIASAREEGVPGDWERIFSIYRTMVDTLPRVAACETLIAALDDLSLLRQEIVNILEMQLKAGKLDATESRSERHIQNSDTEIDSELERQGETMPVDRSVADEPACGHMTGPETRSHGSSRPTLSEVPQPLRDMKIFPLKLVLQACPQIADYGPRGTIACWRDLMSAAVVVRTMLGVSASAFEEACAVMGPETAATIIACVLERGGHITSAGGYLRDLTRRAGQGEFSIGPMLLALVRAQQAVNVLTKREPGALGFEASTLRATMQE
jgi:replication initiation protein RepC